MLLGEQIKKPWIVRDVESACIKGSGDKIAWNYLGIGSSDFFTTRKNVMPDSNPSFWGFLVSSLTE